MSFEYMGVKNIYERFVWFDDQVKGKQFPNATALAEKFELSTKTAQKRYRIYEG